MDTRHYEPSRLPRHRPDPPCGRVAPSTLGCAGPGAEQLLSKRRSRGASRVPRAVAQAPRTAGVLFHEELRLYWAWAGWAPTPPGAGLEPVIPDRRGLPGSPRRAGGGGRGQPRTCVRACVWASPRGGAAGGAARGAAGGAAGARRVLAPSPPARARRMVRPGPRLIVLSSRRPKMAAALEAPGL